MAYRVLNAKTGEVVAEFTDAQYMLALDLADKLAADKKHLEQFTVVQSIAIYETPLIGKEPLNGN